MQIGDVFKVKDPLYDLLEWGHLFSEATHTLVVALSMFVAAKGNIEEAIVGAVMYGRDKDSYASVAGALAGAYRGAESIRKDWIETVSNANREVSMLEYATKLATIIASDEVKTRKTLDDVRSLI